MSNFRRPRRRVDQNHALIVDVLRAKGWKVLSLAPLGGGVPDLLAWFPATGALRLVEVKATKGKLTDEQEVFRCEGWPVHIVRSVDDALQL